MLMDAKKYRLVYGQLYWHVRGPEPMGTDKLLGYGSGLSNFFMHNLEFVLRLDSHRHLFPTSNTK